MNLLLFFFLLKWLQKYHPAKEQQINYQCHRNISPVDLLILNYIRRVRSWKNYHHAIIQKMNNYRNPDILSFHISICHKKPQWNTGNKLACQSRQPHIRRSIIEEVYRQMPYSPHTTQKYHSAFQTKFLLKKRLKIISPSVFFSKEYHYWQEKVYQNNKKYDPGSRICHYFAKFRKLATQSAGNHTSEKI